MFLRKIQSQTDLQFFRNLRNNLAHDYPETIDQTVLTLNTLYKNWDKMAKLYSGVRSYYRTTIGE